MIHYLRTETFGIAKIFLVLVIPFCFWSCLKIDPFPRKLEFQEVLAGDLGGPMMHDLKTQHFVVNDSISWNDLKKRMDYPNHLKWKNAETVDFVRFTVLAVFDTIRGSGGYNIDFQEIYELKDRVQVTVQTSRHGGSLMVGMPFHIVKIPKVEKEVVFVVN